MSFSPAAVHNPANVMPGRKVQPNDRPHACDGCNGSGIYYGAGRVENGVFVGFKGQCFRCGGHGWQNDADRRRNACYDRNRRFTL